MATPNLQLATPANGSFVGTWDQPVNANTTVLDSVAGAVTTKSLTSGSTGLSIPEAQVSILRFTGAISGNCTIFIPVGIAKSWICENLTTGNFWVILTGGSGGFVGLRPGSCQCYWDGTNVKLINAGGIGDYWDSSEADTPLWVQVSSPPPALKCDGSTFSAVTYPVLAARLGGTTLPDFRGRTSAYLDGGTGRITSAGSGIDGATRFSAGGAQNITLDATTIPSHTHPSPTLTDPGHHHTYFGPGSAGSYSGTNGGFFGLNTGDSTTGITLSATTGATGSGGAHNNMPPAVIGGVRMIWAG
jgi:microcystin-dependent protein